MKISQKWANSSSFYYYCYSSFASLATAKTAKQTSPNFVIPYEISCYPASRVVFISKIYVGWF